MLVKKATRHMRVTRYFKGLNRATDLVVAREELGATEQREDLVVTLFHHENLTIT